MSYKNPQKVVSKAFDVSLGLLKAETQDLYRREAEDRKQQRRFGEMATQALMNKKAQQRSFDQTYVVVFYLQLLFCKDLGFLLLINLNLHQKLY